MSAYNDTFENRLDESKIIYICGYVDSKYASDIIFKLLTYSAQDEHEEIQLFISSHGGSDLDMMAIYDTLNTIPNPVTGIAVGMVGDHATLLLAKCTKGKRYSLAHTEISFSQPYGYIAPGANQQTEIAIEAKELFIKREVFEKEMCACTGQLPEVVHEDCEKGVVFTAQEALEYGIIDEIL